MPSGGAPADKPFVGSGDIQSLADLGNSFEVVRTMQIAPITRDAIVRLAAATLVPMVPLLLTMMVKLRYADAPVFLDVASVINQYGFQGTVGVSGSWF